MCVKPPPAKPDKSRQRLATAAAEAIAAREEIKGVFCGTLSAAVAMIDAGNPAEARQLLAWVLKEATGKIPDHLN
jgi:predicted negative regulator of RcsB-dependent stress response